MEITKTTNNLLTATDSQSSLFNEAIKSKPEPCTTHQTWTTAYPAHIAAFLKDHYIEIAARIAGMIAGNRAVIRAVQPGTFSTTMIAAAGFMSFSRAFVGTTAALASGEALLTAVSAPTSNATYFHKTLHLINEHPYTTTAATISGFIGAFWSAIAFADWHLPRPAVAQASIGVGIITYLGMNVVLTSARRLINSVVKEEGKLYQLGAGVGGYFRPGHLE